jgi:Ca2+-binding EF-hand superfamily protein
MLRNNIDITESEVNNLFKRLDLDRDVRITLLEFKKLFNSTPAKPSNYKSSFSSSLSSKLSSSTFHDSNKSSFRNTGGYASPKISSPRRKNFENNTASRLYSPLRDRTLNILNRSIDGMDLNSSLARSPKRMYNTFDNDRRYLRSPLSSRGRNYIGYDEENFISFLRELLEIENDIEKTKIDITFKSDFNIEDAFRNFELDRRGYITEADIQYGLNALDIFASKDEIALLMKRYDFSGEGVIR